MAIPTKWVYDSTHSAAGSSALAGVTSGTVTPTLGDLLIVSTLNFVTTHATSVVITDTGSNPGMGAPPAWSTIRSSFGALGTLSCGAFWRFATATDVAASPFTVTATYNGSGGTNTSRIVVEVHRVPGYVLLGIDSSAITTSVPAVTTLTAFSGGGGPVADGDLLAWQMLASAATNGGVTQNNYLTLNRPSTTTLAATGLGTPLLLATANSDGAAAANNMVLSDTAEQSVFSWTTSRANVAVIGATFQYRHLPGLLPIL